MDLWGLELDDIAGSYMYIVGTWEIGLEDIACLLIVGTCI